MSKNLSELSGRKGIQDNLFDKMGKLALEEGTISKKELAKLADEFLMGTANTYGAMSFYDFMKPDNKNKKVYVCNGSACKNSGKQAKLTKRLGKYFDKDEIGHMTCLGRCHENKAFHFEGKNYSDVSKKDIKKIIKGKSFDGSDAYNMFAYNHQVLTQKGIKMTAFATVLSKVFKMGSEKVLNEIESSNIRGRGGAGFPMAFKLKSARDTPNDTKFIICNADEGDPGAYSDRYLLEKQPYMVLLGMMAAGYVMGANWGILYIRAEYPDAVVIIQKAIDKLRKEKLIGKNILDSGFNFDLKIIKAQGAYICGEETALINSIEGQRPEVRTRPPYPTQDGLFGKPTVVNNVETLAALFYIMENGGEAYAKIGTKRSSGTKLVSLDSFFNNPGIYEVDMGTPLETVVEKLGGGFKKEVKGLHIGGPLGGIVPIHKIKDLNIDFESFNENGFLLGHASIVCIPTKMKMMTYLQDLMEFAKDESCGKCFPCRLGTQRAYELIEKANDTNYKIDRTLFDDLLHTLKTGSLCAHGGGIPLPVRNALDYFGEETALSFQS